MVIERAAERVSQALTLVVPGRELDERPRARLSRGDITDIRARNLGDLQRDPSSTIPARRLSAINVPDDHVGGARRCAIVAASTRFGAPSLRRMCDT